MRVLVAPTWSFGRDKRLVSECVDLIEETGADLHYCESDVDLNLTTMSFSGRPDNVLTSTLSIAEKVLPSIDLTRHSSPFTRTGALDTCPVVWFGAESDGLKWTRALADALATNHGTPVMLTDLSETGRPEWEVIDMRRGGFGCLVGRTLLPDFGPDIAHERLGVTCMGLRPFFIRLNAYLAPLNLHAVRRVVDKIRHRRLDGDYRMTGVRVRGTVLPSRDQSLISLELTMPELVPIESTMEHLICQADAHGLELCYWQVAGAIRDIDLLATPSLHPRACQVIWTTRVESH
ncbi:MAG: hypothetical protein JNM34_00930 [Chthonomonadaceae bacterium]|nr:hypothetical protein [Chthonomonadaceae bacterium]